MCPSVQEVAGPSRPAARPHGSVDADAAAAEGRWISTAWLEAWVNAEGEPPAIDNKALLCPHGKLDPGAVRDMKRISCHAWSMLQVWGKCGEGCGGKCGELSGCEAVWAAALAMVPRSRHHESSMRPMKGRHRAHAVINIFMFRTNHAGG